MRPEPRPPAADAAPPTARAAAAAAPRLLMVTTDASTARGFLLPFARHFRAQGWRVDVLAYRAAHFPELREAYDQTWDITWSRQPLDPRNLTTARRQVRALVQRERYDLVHVHTPVAAFVTRLALRRLRRAGGPRVLYTAHGFHFFRGAPPLRNAAFTALEKLAARWTDELVVMNAEDAQAARRLRFLPEPHLHSMRGIGVDTAEAEHFTLAPAHEARLRAELALPEGARLLLMVAEFIPRKRHEDALQALARLGRPDVVLAFAGIGPLLEPMSRLARTLGVHEQVRFLGHRDDVPALLRASTALLLPSLQEGLPRSVMEAMCLGTPVIGTDIRGTRDLLDDGHGLLVPPRDVDALAHAMARVLDAPEEAWRLAARARERIRGYDLRDIIAQHEQLYGQALGHAGGPA